MIDYFKTKQYPITMEMVLKAFKAVKANNGAAGIDGVSIADYEEKLMGNTYKLWNRMTSGSYCPKPVRAVAIPKKSGGQRVLGIPTVEDRIAQQVVKNYLEPKVDPTFHPDSYGYRPGKNAHQAVTQSLKRSAFIGWVIDLDIKGFFDNLDHELMMKGLKHYTSEKWVLMYVERWLKAGMQKEGGKIVSRPSGTPQGGVISALLANIYLHFTFDKWMEKHFPPVRFERYCDDIVIHCRSEKQALYIKSKVISRMAECKLEINESKTHIVYCKNEQNTERGHHKVAYNFLGYTLRPKLSPTKHGLKLLTAACMSHSSKVDVREKIRKMSIRKFQGNILQLAEKINVQARGWMNYYCKFNKWTTTGIWWYLQRKVVEWTMKTKKIGKYRAIAWLVTVYKNRPKLMVHWQLTPPTLVGRR